MKHLLAITIIAIASALLTLQPSNAIPNKNDLANGWYNLPPVTEDKLQRVIQCLVEKGAPANPSLRADATTHLTGDIPFAPTQIVWMANGRYFETDAVLTYYGPSVAYNEIAKWSGLPQKVIACPEATPTVIEVDNPIGTPYPEKCPTCFRSSGANDRFKGGAIFTDASGRYEKKEGFFAFIRQPYWEKLP